MRGHGEFQVHVVDPKGPFIEKLYATPDILKPDNELYPVDVVVSAFDEFDRGRPRYGDPGVRAPGLGCQQHQSGAQGFWGRATASRRAVGLAPAEVIAADVRQAGVKPGDDMLAIRLSSIGGQLAKIPWVEKVKVRRYFPHTLVIEIVEREPVAQILQPGGLNSPQPLLYTLDAAGHVMLALRPLQRSVPAATNDQDVRGLHELPYNIPNILVDLHQKVTHVPSGSFISVGRSQNDFFLEGFVDEMDRYYVEKGRVKARVIYVPRTP